MKRVLFIVAVIVLSFASCKTSKKAQTYRSAYEPAVENKVIQEQPVPQTPTISAPETPIVFKTEEVTIERSGENKYYNYYVIVGSFSMVDNAYKLQNELLANGQKSDVLKSETGMLRVTYMGTNSEDEARRQISNIRKNLPGFSDVWLLKRK